jgi:hypothetical protein
MQGIHIHIPETNHVSRGYIVAAILSLLLMVPLFLVPAIALLFFYVSTFRSMCAVPNMAVFCSSLTSWFPVMSLTYFLDDLEMVPPLLLHSTRAVFLLGLYILKSRLLFKSHFCLLGLLYLLTFRRRNFLLNFSTFCI